jgi:superfamily II DNA/RNA helicase
MQIVRECQRFTTIGIRAVGLIGLTSVERQLENIRKSRAHIIVGTPGRLAQVMLERQGRRLSAAFVRTVVLDEVDRLLEGVHRHDTERLLLHLRSPMPAGTERQFVFVSATSDQANVLQAVLQCTRTKPFLLRMGSASSASSITLPDTIRHFYVKVPEHLRMDTIRKLTYAVTRLLVSPVDPLRQSWEDPEHLRTENLELTNEAIVQTIVFVADQRTADIYAERLDARGVIAAALSGRMEGSGPRRSKFQRAEVMDYFRNGTIRVLVTTELAARGLDFPDVGLVVNAAGLPTDVIHYAHRAGRTGRLNRRGCVVSLIPEAATNLSILRRLVRGVGAQLIGATLHRGLLRWEH